MPHARNPGMSTPGLADSSTSHYWFLLGSSTLLIPVSPKLPFSSRRTPAASEDQLSLSALRVALSANIKLEAD
jgi:hypothetical protein